MPPQTTSTPVSPATAGFSIAAAAAIIFNTLLAWAKESNPSLLAAMKSAMGHHWITHGTAVVVVFLVCGFIFSKLGFPQRMNGATLAMLLTIATVLGGLGLIGFFLLY